MAFWTGNATSHPIILSRTDASLSRPCRVLGDAWKRVQTLSAPIRVLHSCTADHVLGPLAAKGFLTDALGYRQSGQGVPAFVIEKCGAFAEMVSPLHSKWDNGEIPGCCYLCHPAWPHEVLPTDPEGTLLEWIGGKEAGLGDLCKPSTVLSSNCSTNDCQGPSALDCIVVGTG